VTSKLCRITTKISQANPDKIRTCLTWADCEFQPNPTLPEIRILDHDDTSELIWDREGPRINTLLDFSSVIFPADRPRSLFPNILPKSDDLLASSLSVPLASGPVAPVLECGRVGSGVKKDLRST